MKFKMTNNPCFAFIGLVCSVLLPSALYEMFAKKPFLFASILAIFFVFFITNYNLTTSEPTYCKLPLLLVSKSGECVEKCPDGMISDTIACIDCYKHCATCSGVFKNQCITCIDGYYREGTGNCVPNVAIDSQNNQLSTPKSKSSRTQTTQKLSRLNKSLQKTHENKLIDGNNFLRKLQTRGERNNNY